MSEPLVEANVSLTAQASSKPEFREEKLPPEEVMFGNSSALEDVRKTANNLASKTAPVLITGETGTGKEILAWYIHSNSPWREGPFVKVNCPILRYSSSVNDPFSEAILSLISPSETAMSLKQEPAQGTLVLNEISLLDPGLQIRLLEKLDEGHLVRVALSEHETLNLRLI